MVVVQRKNIKLAIHDAPGGFSDRWIRYCWQKGLAHKIVDCFAVDLFGQLRDVDGLLWHWTHDNSAGQLVARQIITSAEMAGIKVFPNRQTCWHYDDKIAQKYALEAIGAAIVPSHVFFDEEQACQWINTTDYPKVFKLRCGAGSRNVKLVTSQKQAIALCKTAFDCGFDAKNGYFDDFQTKLRKSKRPAELLSKIRRFPATLAAIRKQRAHSPKQIGYIYFQDFMPGNAFDTRVTVIGHRAFGCVRQNRPNDFRASGSGMINYSRDNVDVRCIEMAFTVSSRLKAQCLAYDFLFDENHRPRISEFSYCFPPKNKYMYPGYWDDSLTWHSAYVCPEYFIIEDLIKDILSSKPHPVREEIYDPAF
ncbi:hypothetical protein JW998_06065 [candidate division KSB1 bacterium]|nr:hypothetical protein [candidate division KSB1 bacterium]